MQRTFAAITVIAVTAVAAAQPTLEIVDLGGGSFDVNVADLGPGASAWTTAGLYGTATGGAEFVYPTDPNTGENLITQRVPSGTGRTDVTFVSLPTEQTAASRFDIRGVPAIAGGYIGQIDQPQEDWVDVAWFDLPGGPIFETGYIARVVLDISATGFPDDDVSATAGTAPYGSTILASGLLAVTTDIFTDASAAEIDWTVYAIPEPATLTLLVLGGLAAVRHSRERSEP